MRQQRAHTKDMDGRLTSFLFFFSLFFPLFFSLDTHTHAYTSTHTHTYLYTNADKSIYSQRHGRAPNEFSHTHTHTHTCVYTNADKSVYSHSQRHGRAPNEFSLSPPPLSLLSYRPFGWVPAVSPCFCVFFSCDSNVLMSLVKDIDRHLADFGGNE